MTTLLILAHNEERNIENVLEELHENFQQIIVVNDASRDSTGKILDNLKKKYKNLLIVNNEKNLGAGKTFVKGIDKFLEIESDILVKVDGDGQFLSKDVINLKKLMENGDYDFIKCDRFWEGGIVGKIPVIRYLGNAFASFLIKFITGNFLINDPLNGLVALNKKVIKDFYLPKLFSRYGYPFWLTSFMSNLVISENIKIGQYRNVVKYEESKKSINPLKMFFKLTFFTILEYFRKIKVKLKYSKFQMSAICDIISLIFLSIFLYSYSRYWYLKNLIITEPYNSWIALSFFSIFCLFLSLIVSKRIESKILIKNFEDIYEN